MPKRIERIEYPDVAAFSSISLAQAAEVSLQRRHDRKYVLPLKKLQPLLQILVEDYDVLSNFDKAYRPYETRYYDTPNSRFYMQHHNGRLPRLKIRRRRYEDSGDEFWELKKRNNKGETQKRRIALSTDSDDTDRRINNLLQSEAGIGSGEINEVLKVSFHRLTLVSKGMDERCTIDIALKYRNGNSEFYAAGLVILERKQKSPNLRTALDSALKQLSIREQRISKYCYGRSRQEPELKQNLFKERKRMIDKILREE